jgi:type II secretory pathway pseudopilin PulG
VRRRPAFALAVVLAALVLMSMSVAVAAQRALVAARQARLQEAAAEVTAAAAAAEAELIGAVLPAPCCATALPGELLASGVATAGRARAEWRVTGAASAYAQAEVVAEARTAGGTARSRRTALLSIVGDSAGGARLFPFGALGWVALPSP